MSDHWIYPELSTRRTIRILFPSEHWAPAFRHSEYQRYGTVRLRRYDIVKDHLQCLIEFEDEGVVDKILSDGYIYVKDEKIKVEPMTTLDSNTASTMNNGESIIDNEFNIIGLNDDCIRSIFLQLHMRTLWSLANVCLRFNDLAKEVFRLKYRNSEIGFSDASMNNSISLKQIEAFLKTFGSSIRKLRIGPDFKKLQLTDVLLQINRNCPNIKSLNMLDLVVGSEIISLECLSVFSRLESLAIRFSGDSTNYSAILQKNVLPKLTSLTIMTKNYEHLESCFSSQINWQLEELNIAPSQEICFRRTIPKQPSSHLFPLICERYPNIRILNIELTNSDENFSTNVLQLSQLKRLRNLRLDFNRNNASPLLEAILRNDIQLELLNICKGVIESDTIDIISQIKSLRSLEIMFSKYDQDELVQLVKKLPILSRLFIWPNWRINIPTSAANIFDMVTSIISNGMNLSELQVTVQNFTEITSYTTKEYNALLAIVKQRLKPATKLEVIISSFTCPKNVAHYVTIDSSPELLSLKISYGDTKLMSLI